MPGRKFGYNGLLQLRLNVWISLMMKVSYLRISAVLFAVVGLAPLRLAEALVRAKGPVVAKLDNVAITEYELKVEAQTLPLKKQEYEMKWRALAIYDTEGRGPSRQSSA